MIRAKKIRYFNQTYIIFDDDSTIDIDDFCATLESYCEDTVEAQQALDKFVNDIVEVEE